MNKHRGRPKVREIRTLADLTPDKLNARKHGERNIGMLERSLEQYGAARSIVVDENGKILAGHGVVEAAANVGIEKVVPVEASGNEIIAVVRRGLTERQKTELALADNRTAELAEWSPEILKSLAEDADLGKFWTEKELALLLNIEMPGMTAEQAHETLAERFGVPPFSVLDARQGYWQDRKRAWLALGIQSELGRGDNLQSLSESNNQYRYNKTEFFKRAASKTALHDSKGYASPLDRKRRQYDVTDGRTDGRTDGANARRRSRVRAD